MKISPTQKPKPLPIDRARSYVSKMDAAVERQGGDKQTFIVACKLVEFGLTPAEAKTVLSEYNQRCQPPWDEKKLNRKLACAFSRTNPKAEFANGNARSIPKFEAASDVVSKWPEYNAGERRRIVGEMGFGLSDLYDLSPVRFSDDKPHTVEILRFLFPRSPLVCCGKSSAQFWTRPLFDYGRAVESFQFVVPNPMSKLVGKIQDPEPDGPFESAHTKDNTGPRVFAVIEFDHGPADDHAALMHHLSEYSPLVLAVHSGGKSLHGWFKVAGEPEPAIFRFYRYAVSIGADRATFLKSQFVRMPDGRRNSGARQCVYYFDPSPLDDHE